jgi:hypothetical protein
VSEIEGLIERLQAAKGPDPLLDGDIGWEIGGWINEGGFWRRHKVTGKRERFTYRDWPLYTRSIDAALTLVPEGMWWLVGCGQMKPTEPLYGAQIRKPGFSTGGQVVSEAEHSCMAITLCIAALRARLSLQIEGVSRG